MEKKIGVFLLGFTMCFLATFSFLVLFCMAIYKNAVVLNEGIRISLLVAFILAFIFGFYCVLLDKKIK